MPKLKKKSPRQRRIESGALVRRKRIDFDTVSEDDDGVRLLNLSDRGSTSPTDTTSDAGSLYTDVGMTCPSVTSVPRSLESEVGVTCPSVTSVPRSLESDVGITCPSVTSVPGLLESEMPVKFKHVPGKERTEVGIRGEVKVFGKPRYNKFKSMTFMCKGCGEVEDQNFRWRHLTCVPKLQLKEIISAPTAKVVDSETQTETAILKKAKNDNIGMQVETPVLKKRREPETSVLKKRREPAISVLKERREPAKLVPKVRREPETSVLKERREPATSVPKERRESVTSVPKERREPATSVPKERREPETSVPKERREPETSVLKERREPATSVPKERREPETSVSKERREPQGTGGALKSKTISKLNKLLLRKSSSVPSATYICDKMTHIRQAVGRKETTGSALELLNFSKPRTTYSKEVAPEPPGEVTSVQYASFNTNLMKVYWKPSAKDRQIDGYKVLTSEDGDVWSVARVVSRRRHCANDLKPAMSVGVCSFKGGQDSEIVVSSSIGKKSLNAESSELYRTSSFICITRLRSSIFFNTEKYPYIDIPRCRVKMVPMLYHKVLCTPIKLTSLSDGLRLDTESDERIIKSVTLTYINSSTVKYCFCLEKDLVSLILNSKDPSFGSYGIQVLVRFCLNDQSYIHDDEVPDCIVRVNNEVALVQIQDKHIGPLDITKWCNFTEGKDSEDFLSIEWMPSHKKSHCFTVCVAEKLSIPGIVSNLMIQNVKDCFTTKEMVRNKFEYDKYVSCTGLKASLACPLGKTRIVSPCRGSNCTHIQCMDALTMLKMNEGRPLSKKKCFMCDEPIGDIYIDGLFLEILSSVPETVDEIEFKQDGSWSYEIESNSDDTVKIPETTCTYQEENTNPQCDMETKKEASSPVKEIETEEDIYGAMKTHLSRLKSQVDQLEYLSKQHEQFKEKIVGGLATGDGDESTVVDLIDNEDQGLVDLTSDNDQKFIEPTFGKVKKIEKDCGVVNEDNVVNLLDDEVSSVADLRGENKQGRLKPADSIWIDCVGKLKKAKQSGKTKETEKKIDDLIANMLKCVKKSEHDNVREKDDESLVDKSEGVKGTECAESDVPVITFEDTDDDDIVEIDLVTGNLKKDEIDSADCGIIGAFKEDGTLASGVEMSLSGDVHHHARNRVLPGSGKQNKNQDNDESDAIGERRNKQVRANSMPNDTGKDLNVGSKKKDIYLDLNSEIKCKLVNKCKKGSPEKDKERTRNLRTMQHSKSECKRNEKADSQGGTGKKVGYDMYGEAAKTKLKMVKIPSTDRGSYHSRTKEMYKILKLDGTPAESDILRSILLSPVTKRKDHEIDLKLNDSTVNITQRDNRIHLEKEHPEICDEQINMDCDNLETEQRISPIRTGIGSSPEKKHSHFQRLPRSSHKDLETYPSQTDCRKSYREQDNRISLKQSDDVPPSYNRKLIVGSEDADEDTSVISHKWNARKRKKKLIVDVHKEMSEEYFRNRVLFHTELLKKKMDLAPPTKEQMRRVESGITRKQKKSLFGPDLEDVLRSPCIPLQSKKLQRFYERYVSSSHEPSADYFDPPKYAVNLKREVKKRTLKVKMKKRSLKIQNRSKSRKKMRTSTGKVLSWRRTVKALDTSETNIGQTKAVDAVKEKALTVTQGSQKYDIHVPSTTTKHSLTDKKLPGLGLGGNVEDDLTKVLKHLTEYGFILSSNMVSSFAKEIIDRYGNINEGADKLNLIAQVLRNVFKSDPDIAKLLNSSRFYSESGMGFEDYTSRWFASLNRILSKYGIKNKPERIYSCERFDLKPVGLVKNLNSETSVEQDHVASNGAYAHLCICSDGKFLPPKVTFQTVPSTRDNGPTFLEWFKTVFLPNCGQERPVCLLMVNLTCDLTLPLVEKAIENEVVLIGLPLLDTHVLQPLEAKITEPLNSHIQDRCCSLDPDSTIPDNSFHIALQYGIDQIAPSLVREAFRATGICPLGKAAKRVNKSLILICPEQYHSEETDQISSTVATVENIVKLEVDPEHIMGTFRTCGEDTEQFAQRTDGIAPLDSVKGDNQELCLSNNDTTLSVTNSNQQIPVHNEVVPVPTIIDIRSMVPASTKIESDMEQSGQCDNDITLTDFKVELNAEYFAQGADGITPAVSVKGENQELFLNSNDTTLSVTGSNEQTTGQSVVIPMPAIIDIRSMVPASTKTENGLEQSDLCDNDITQADIKVELNAEQADCSWNAVEETDVAYTEMDCYYRKELIDTNQHSLAQGNPKPQKSSKRERQKLGLIASAPLEKITSAAVRGTACKQEDFVVNSGKNTQKCTKRIFSDKNQDPVVCLKRRKELDVEGHNIYV